MISRHIDAICKEDIELLVTTPRIEDRQIEYKQALPSNSDEDKREFLADVCAFANASGGDVVFGIVEKAGVPIEAKGVPLPSFDRERLRLQSVVRDGIAPKIPRMELVAVPGFEEGSVVVLRVYESLLSPHMVTFKNSSRFYLRDPGQRHQMDVQELRLAFAGSERFAERLQNFRTARLAKILAGDTPVATWQHPTLVIHIAPTGRPFTEGVLDVRALQDRWHSLNRSDFVYAPTNRYNLDGLLLYSSIDLDRHQKSRAYIQIYRSGVIEAVAMLTHGGEPVMSFSGRRQEEAIVQFLKTVDAFYREWQLESPVYVLISLLRMRSVAVQTDELLRALATYQEFDRDIIALPEALVEPGTTNPGTPLRHAFHTMWQAAGYNGSPGYKPDGEWSWPTRD